MLEIYINPDNNIMLLDLENPFSNNLKSSNGLLYYHTKELNLEAIQFLLKELRMRRYDEKTMVYEAYVSMLLKDKNSMEKSVNNLQDILNKNNENISAWVALAMMNLITLKFNEVKTNLRIIEKSSLNIKYYNDYIRGLLIYSYLLLIPENSNVKKAEDLLLKVINEIDVAQSNNN